FKWSRGAETEELLCLFDTSDSIGDKHLLLGSILRHKAGARQRKQELDQLVDRGSNSHANVEELIGAVSLHAQDVRLRDVFDINEIENLAAIAEDDRRLARENAVEDLHDHAHICALVVHARPIDIHVAVSDV